jgi:hypothetical protein
MVSLFLAAVAFANGQSSHLWITEQAVGAVEEPELAAFLADPEVLVWLANGTMFPDGGYAVDHPYGETAHWEPFHDLYLDWIVANHTPPWTAEGRRHVAFYLGMVSHGLADQVFDALYLERSRRFDADLGWAAGESMDEATDVAFIAEVGPREIPARQVPTEALGPLFAQAGVPVSASTLVDGQRLLSVAIFFVGGASQNPDALAGYQAEFPWATSHQADPAVPGNPPDEIRFIAAGWERAWDRLHGRLPATGAGFLLGTSPTDGGYDHGTAPDDMNAWVTLVFAEALPAAAVVPDAFFWTRDDGIPVPFTARLYYGNDSNVVQLVPEVSLDAGHGYRAGVLPGLVGRRGTTLETELAVTFFTYPAPVQPEPAGCGCHALPSSSFLSGFLPWSLVFVGGFVWLGRSLR